MPKIIAISVHKGGVGKTTTAMAVSAALARSGKHTLLVDLDAQGHCAKGLGFELEPGAPTIRDLFADPPTPAANIIKQTRVGNLDILPSDIRFATTSSALYMRPKRERLLARALESVQENYDYIVLDCPPALGPITEAGIAAADLILVPCKFEARTSDGLADLFELIRIVKGEQFENWRILITNVDNRKSVTNDAVTAALEPWKHKLLQTQIPLSEPLNQAQIAGTDIFSFDPKSKGAVAYETLISELL
jgi:chromosome partitioning protein